MRYTKLLLVAVFVLAGAYQAFAEAAITKCMVTSETLSSQSGSLQDCVGKVNAGTANSITFDSSIGMVFFDAPLTISKPVTIDGGENRSKPVDLVNAQLNILVPSSETVLKNVSFVYAEERPTAINITSVASSASLSIISNIFNVSAKIGAPLVSAAGVSGTLVVTGNTVSSTKLFGFFKSSTCKGLVYDNNFISVDGSSTKVIINEIGCGDLTLPTDFKHIASYDRYQLIFPVGFMAFDRYYFMEVKIFPDGKSYNIKPALTLKVDKSVDFVCSSLSNTIKNCMISSNGTATFTADEWKQRMQGKYFIVYATKSDGSVYYNNLSEGESLVALDLSGASLSYVKLDAIKNEVAAVDDDDSDGILNGVDNCLKDKNPDQLDTDEDGVGDACDNCMLVKNAGQEHSDGNKIGDACKCLDANKYTDRRTIDGCGPCKTGFTAGADGLCVLVCADDEVLDTDGECIGKCTSLHRVEGTTAGSCGDCLDAYIEEAGVCAERCTKEGEAWDSTTQKCKLSVAVAQKMNGCTIVMAGNGSLFALAPMLLAAIGYGVMRRKKK